MQLIPRTINAIAAEPPARPAVDTVADEIVVARDRKALRIRWAGGRDTVLTASALRTACRCAWCGRDRILGRFDVGGPAVEIVAVEALGSHGLHLRFSDGHGRGSFPWPYLAELAEAAPERAAPADDRRTDGAAA